MEAQSPTPEIPQPDSNQIVETRVKRPNLFWRRIAAFLTDVLLFQLIGTLLSVAMESQLLAAIFAWIVFATIWYSAHLRFGRGLGKWLLGIRVSIENPTAEKSPRLLGRFAIQWGAFFVLDLPAIDPGVAVSGDGLSIYNGISLIVMAWFLAMTVSMATTGGHRGLHDLICSTAVDFQVPRFLSTSRRTVATLCSLLALVKPIAFMFLPQPEDSSLAILPAIEQSPQRANQEFAPQDILAFFKDRVFEIQTRWQQPGGFLWLKTVDAGQVGTGLLFANNKKFGLVCSNWHVVAPSESVSGNYHVRLRRNSDEDYVEGTVIARAKDGVDLALILIDLGEGWVASTLRPASVDELTGGEHAVAIGNALGEGISITDGLISRIDRIQNTKIIRTSAPISPGNSGGPLILKRGALFAGINTAENVQNGVQNINYAIPSEYLYNSANWEFLLDDAQEVKALLDGTLN